MIITLLTDFGLRDPFVGIMKGVILGLAPEARLVDLTHEIRSYDIREAAFLLETAYGFFPPGTVHLVVVDPGVGSERRPLAATAGGHIFVAPDNGVLSRLADPMVHYITNDSLFLNPVSHTFHGRDIFAPVAAHLARGVALESAGPRVSDFVRFDFSKKQILRVDKFGNLVTSLRGEHFLSPFCIRVAGHKITRLCTSYAEAAPGELFAIEGSTGYIEISLNQGSAREKLNIGPGTEFDIE